jgi:hypothetical protein
MEIAESFIMNQRNLHDLTATADFLQKLANFSLKFCESLKLKRLEFGCKKTVDENILKFLRSQSASVEELKVLDCNLNFTILEEIFRNFTSLKTLRLECSKQFDEQEIAIIKSCHLPKLQELKFIGYHEEFMPFDPILYTCPNLKVFIAEITDVPLNELLEKLPKLQKIKSTNLKLEMVAFGKSTSLLELDFLCYNPPQDDAVWTTFAANSPNIQKFAMKMFALNYDSTEAKEAISIFMKSLKHFKNLKHCEIHNISVVYHDENQENQEQVVSYGNCKFILKKFENSSDWRLEISSYFEKFHASCIENLKNDFNIRSYATIDYN